MRLHAFSCLIAFAALSLAQTVEEELQGLGDSNKPTESAPDPAARQRVLEMLRGGSPVLLIPESTNDRVMAFDPVTGDLVDADFIPADPTNLSTPIQAMGHPTNGNILVSDQLDDVVQEYTVMGVYVGVFAPAGGANPAILDNIRGIEIGPGNSLLVSVGGGANDDAIAQFDTAGVYLGNFVANGAGGLDSPFDVLARASDYLVNGITSDAIHRYDTAGAYIADLTAINTFPEQAFENGSGNILIANFSGTEEGVVEYTSTGTQVGIYDPASLGGYRGVYELPNGNILTTNGGGVHEIDRMGNLVETKIAGVSGRFITLFGATGGTTADLSIQKTSSAMGGIDPGASLSFTLTVTNAGPDPATNVVVIDTLPAGFVYASNTCGAAVVGQDFTWNVGGLASGAMASCTIDGSVDPAFIGSLVNTASVSARETDPNTADNQSTVTVSVRPPVPALGPGALAALLILLAGAAIFVSKRN